MTSDNENESKKQVAAGSELSAELGGDPEPAYCCDCVSYRAEPDGCGDGMDGYCWCDKGHEEWNGEWHVTPADCPDWEERE